MQGTQPRVISLQGHHLSSSLTRKKTFRVSFFQEIFKYEIISKESGLNLELKGFGQFFAGNPDGKALLTNSNKNNAHWTQYCI